MTAPVPRPARLAGAVGPWLVTVAVEASLYATYRGHDARFHWFTHFLVGAAAALAAMSAAAWRLQRPAPWWPAWVIGGHLLALFPDVLFRLGVAHQRWMDVFLGHVSTHVVWGRNATWYAAFAFALGAYLATLDRLRRTVRP